MKGRRPARLEARSYEKVWGSPDTAPWFPPDGRKIGEVWFTADPPLPVLLKFLFTSERLSVQVHPNDAQAASEGSRGKTEMWHILRASADASIALGFRETLTREQLREASMTGEIERLLEWVPVGAGETYFTPAGTVHAIGGGIAMCEIQQNSDVTYRLYDYGRPRELHLEKGVAVAHLGPYQGRAEPRDLGVGVQRLVDCEYFRTDELTLSAACDSTPGVVIVLEGQGLLGGEPFRTGEAWLASEPLRIEPDGRAVLLRVSY